MIKRLRCIRGKKEETEPAAINQRRVIIDDIIASSQNAILFSLTPEDQTFLFSFTNLHHQDSADYVKYCCISSSFYITESLLPFLNYIFSVFH